MVDILHRIGATAAPGDVYAALTTIEGLSSWWTQDTDGDPDVGGVIRFRFDAGGFDMKVLEARPAERVCWEVVDGPEEWIGTRIRFELKREGDFTVVLFRHEGWKEPVEFMYHCSTKWATFLMSLKKLVETGKGEPAPQDVKISNWH
ncbi:SRPBCC family protein [Streptomyces bicolor]|uniref:SRPBCC family protein n=1 Tax=Streptomyces bicolor TaxID=66874 RepID=UPI0004E1D333|nr:SRPBCC domain-containing protein [Streptomyces bicolor]